MRSYSSLRRFEGFLVDILLVIEDVVGVHEEVN